MTVLLHPKFGVRLLAPKPERPEPPPPADLSRWPGEPPLRFLLRNGVHVTVYPGGYAFGRLGRTIWSGASVQALARALGWES